MFLTFTESGNLYLLNATDNCGLIAQGFHYLEENVIYAHLHRTVKIVQHGWLHVERSSLVFHTELNFRLVICSRRRFIALVGQSLGPLCFHWLQGSLSDSCRAEPEGSAFNASFVRVHCLVPISLCFLWKRFSWPPFCEVLFLSYAKLPSNINFEWQKFYAGAEFRQVTGKKNSGGRWIIGDGKSCPMRQQAAQEQLLPRTLWEWVAKPPYMVWFYPIYFYEKSEEIFSSSSLLIEIAAGLVFLYAHAFSLHSVKS